MFPYNSGLLSVPAPSTTITTLSSSTTRVPSVPAFIANPNDRLQQPPPMTWPPVPLVHLPTSGGMFHPQLVLGSVLTTVPTTTPSMGYKPSITNTTGVNLFIPPSTPMDFARTAYPPPPRVVSPFGPMVNSNSNVRVSNALLYSADVKPTTVLQSDDSSVGSNPGTSQHGKWTMDRPSKRPKHPSLDDLESDDSSSIADEEESHPESLMDGIKITPTNNGDSPKSEKSFGEKRLIIRFESLGTCIQRSPRLGQQGNAIPSGLVGFFTAYNEQWKVEIRYDADEYRQAMSGVTCITWSITNLRSMHTIARQETIDEANTRERNGRTITNQVCKQALQKRAMELEALLAKTTNADSRSSIIADIKALRPKRFTQGPLFFGLLHRCVQMHVQ